MKKNCALIILFIILLISCDNSDNRKPKKLSQDFYLKQEWSGTFLGPNPKYTSNTCLINSSGEGSFQAYKGSELVSDQTIILNESEVESMHEELTMLINSNLVSVIYGCDGGHYNLSLDFATNRPNTDQDNNNSDIVLEKLIDCDDGSMERSYDSKALNEILEKYCQMK